MDLSWLLGQAKTSLHHAADSVLLPARSGDKLSLSDICRSATPSCRLSPLLFNGHLQTFWTVAKDQNVPIYYKRKVFEADDPDFAGTFTVDFVVDQFSSQDDSLPSRTVHLTPEESDAMASLDRRPMLVTLHGLSGGSHELYLRHVLAPLVTKDAGWEACVINSRGCSRSSISTGVLYNARATWDVRQLVLWLRLTFPNRPLFGLGFSLGANILTNVSGSGPDGRTSRLMAGQYLGEEGSSCLFEAAAVCSNPWNLETGSIALQSSWLGLEVYSRTMASNMKRLAQT